MSITGAGCWWFVVIGFGVDYCWCWSLAFAMIAVVNWRLLLLVLITRVSDRCSWWWLLVFGVSIYRLYILLRSPRGLPSSYRKRVIPPYRIPHLHWSYISDWGFSLIKSLTAVLLSIHYVDSKQKIQIKKTNVQICLFLFIPFFRLRLAPDTLKILQNYRIMERTSNYCLHVSAVNTRFIITLMLYDRCQFAR